MSEMSALTGLYLSLQRIVQDNYDLKKQARADRKTIKSLQANLRDEKIKVARLQMIAYGAVDDEYATYYYFSLQGEPTEKDDE